MISINKAFRAAASVKLTIFCLILLSVMIVWGTFYQVEYGQHAAQKRFFSSWILFIYGILPFPGVKTTISVLSINLLAAAFFSFRFTWKKAGILLIHSGTAVLILGAAVSSFMARETVLPLYEKGKASESFDYDTWELLVTRQEQQKSEGAAETEKVNISDLKPGKQVLLPLSNFLISVKSLYENCTALGQSPDKPDSLKPSNSPVDNSPGIPGMTVTVSKDSFDLQDIVLYGGAKNSSEYISGSDTFSLKLQPAKVKLPVEIELIRFSMETHPGTTNARSFQSRIRFSGYRISREVSVSMNRPFRYGSFTFYQTGYSIENGRKISILTVVENPVRLAPYYAGLVIIAGLLMHFIVKFQNMYRNMRKAGDDR